MSSQYSNKRRVLNTTKPILNEGTTNVPLASQRVLAIPELLSLVFGFLAHTDVAPSEGEEDTEFSSFAKPGCSCPCRQCLVDDGENATGVISLPSSFAIPLVKQTRRGCIGRGTRGRGGKKDEKEEERSDRAVCHCQISTQGQLSTLFGKTTTPRRVSGPNKPTYNLSNALVCKLWSPIALSVLWRVVDRPERLFALLDGSWGTKLKPTSHGASERLKGLRGLRRAEWGEGRMPVWWEPGVQAFLDLSDEENEDDESEFEGSEEATPPHKVRRRDFELFSFRSAPTPASWARFDRYARLVRHLVYTRPCLSESALNQVAVTRPRLVVLPRMHTLTWADNPLQHAVLFMHTGVTRLELRVEVFGREKIDPHVSAEQILNTYNDLGLNDFSFSGGVDGQEKMGELFGLGSMKENVKPNRTITRTLATQLAEIPRRMPNIQTLCISSFVPVSLYLPALLCTLLRTAASSTSDVDTPSPSVPTLQKLRRVVLPRFYTNGPVLEHLSRFPQLEVIEYQFDDALGWGRPNDVGLGRCVPKDWDTYEPDEERLVEDAGETTPRRGWFGALVGSGNAEGGKEDVELEVQGTSDSEEEELELTPQPSPKFAQVSPTSTGTRLPVSSPIFTKLCDLNLTIPLTDARDLFLSSPPKDANSTATSDTFLLRSPVLPSTSLADRGLPTWPQNLVCLYLDTPPGFLASPTEIKALVDAIALACYGPSTGQDRKPARLERLSIVCCIDLDSGYYALSEGSDEDIVLGVGDEKYLSRKTIESLLELLPGTTKPKFALKSFEIIHHYPLWLTQGDVEVIAERWGGCIEKLVLNCEPVAAFGITGSGMLDDGEGVGLATEANLDRPGATLTLAALLPFARYCTQLTHLGLFVDASRGMCGLMGPVFSRNSDRTLSTEGEDDPIDDFTSKIAQRYLKYPFSHPSIPNAYPVFHKLERLSLGTSVYPVSLDELDVQFTTPKHTSDRESSVGDVEDDEGQSNVGQAGSTISFDEDEDEDGQDGMDREELMSALRDAARARVEGKESVAGEKGAGQGEGEGIPQTSEDATFAGYICRSGVRLGLLQEDQLESNVKALTSTEQPSLGQDSSSLIPLFLAQILPCFPSQNHGGSPATSSAFTTVIEAGTTLSACPTSLMSSSWAIQKYWTVGEPYELEKENQRRRRRRRQREAQEQEGATSGAGSGTSAASPSPQPPTEDDTSVPPNASSTLVVPFLPPSPSFSPPSGYLPRLLSSVFRARVKKWLEMNEGVLPTAVAMREGGWVWGGRVASELGKTQSEVDELQVRVEVMDGLTQTRARIGRGLEDKGKDKGLDGCIIC